MTFFVSATAAARPSGRTAFFLALAGAALLIFVVVAQLFTFEDFPGVFAAYPFVGDSAIALVLAAKLVTIEVLAVPYLLFMRLSPLMRRISLLCGWLTGIFWLMFGVYIAALGGGTMNSGLLGATLNIDGCLLPLLFGVSLIAVLIATRHSLSRRSNK